MGYILPEIYAKRLGSWDKVPKVFVETGTYKGGIPHRIMQTRVEQKITPILDPVFDAYYTIEIDKTICAIASQRYKDFETYGLNITHDVMHGNNLDPFWNGKGYYFDAQLQLIEGDSGTELEKLINGLDCEFAFWLDAHAGAAKYGRGNDDSPLLKELEIIKKHHIKTHVIAIDDVHLFGTTQYDKKTGQILCDYSKVTYNKVHNKIKEINPNYDIGVYAPFNMQMILAVVQ